MTLGQLLRVVVYSCIYMAYACQRSSTGATPQSVAKPLAPLPVTGRCSSTARQDMFHLSSPGISLRKASPGFEGTSPCHLSQDCFHGQTAIRTSPPASALCCPHWADIERYRQSGSKRDAQSRTEAWLTGGQSDGRARFSWNISLIACCIPNLLKLTQYWCQTSFGTRADRSR
jgi:hypothetical protein